MKKHRIAVYIVFVVFLSLVFSTTGHAVHDGSVGECDHCHKVHGGNEFLLAGADQSSTCLKCHAGYLIGPTVTFAAANSPFTVQLTPGGDFAWLNLDLEFKDRTALPTVITSRGERHGHSIVASEFGYFADNVNRLAPGGTYPAAILSCVSCHDPHNRYRRVDSAGTKAPAGAPITSSGTAGQYASPDTPVGVYRLLGGVGYDSYSGTPFQYPPPDAVAFGDDLHVTYGQGMSEWCANCHSRFLNTFYVSGVAGQMHPAGKSARLTPSIVNNYQQDLKSSNFLSGYSPFAPVEEGNADYDTQRLHAAAGGNITNVTARSNVMCLTCHRAHASPWNSALRWPYGLLNSKGGNLPDHLADSTGRYDRFRGMLCNKCHGKDN